MFKVNHPALRIECAVKIVDMNKWDKKSENYQMLVEKLMKQELQVLFECKHPNIPTVYEMFQCGEVLYIVTEVIRGGELTKKIKDLE